MRIAFFSNQFAARVGHGIKRYSAELVEAFRAVNGIDLIPVAGWSSYGERELAALKARTDLELTGLGRHGTSLLWTFLDAPPLERLLESPVDIVHAASLGYPVATRKPFVATVHDLGPLVHPEFFTNTRPWVMKRSLQQAVAKAKAIVCVSQATADEVREYVGPAVDGRLHVVREGVRDAFFKPVAPDCLDGLDLPANGVPFVLTAGKISPRKNVTGVIRAMGLVKNAIPHHLVLVGGDGWDTGPVRNAITEAGLAGRVHQVGFVSNLQLRALYRAAALYVHPSLYEGFGLTVLEAMASGTPVVTSDRSSLPEVAGDAGLLMDPMDIEAIAEAIVTVGSDPELTRTMTEAGLARARSFTWAGVAERMAGIYRQVAGVCAGETA